jgi:hypothetical protein
LTKVSSILDTGAEDGDLQTESEEETPIKKAPMEDLKLVKKLTSRRVLSRLEDE